MSKFGKIEEFIDATGVEEVNERGQALLLADEDVYGGTVNVGYCPNGNSGCSGAVNVGYCPNNSCSP